jgi:predicted nuclease of restriction endonuclease-like (RecB) superfamily
MVEVDENYHLVLKQLTDKINGSRYKVSRVANTELLGTYWEIGRTLLEQREKAGWGKKIIEKLVNDLKAKFPNMKGLSQRNLEYMQTFASAWPSFPFPQPAAAEIPEIDKSSIPQFKTAELYNNDYQIFNNQQPLLSQIPWTHHMLILDKAKTPIERLFYIKEAIKNGWNIKMLKINIEIKAEMPTVEELEQELEREIEIMLNPIEEKKSKAKEILAEVKAHEVKKEKKG